MDLKDLVIMGLIVYSSVYILCRIYINHSVNKEYCLRGEKTMNCDICKIELEEEYYHLHQGLCEKCERKAIEEYYKE